MERSVRTARLDDAPAIARVHVASWRAAYAGLLPEGVLASRTVEVRTRHWVEWLSDGAPRRILVAERNGAVVGFGAAGPARGGGPRTAELYSLYLAPEALGEGFGTLLWNALADPLAGDGFREAVLWVADGNERALRFYEARGFRADGGRRSECFDGAPMAALRCRTTLSDLAFAQGFARALDAEDFDGAARRLDPDAVYDTGKQILRGSEAIVASYRAAATRARALLEELVNESAVEALEDRRFRVRYTDRLQHRGERHAFRCEQILTVPPARGVTRIEHRELPGERAALDAFLERAGVHPAT